MSTPQHGTASWPGIEDAARLLAFRVGAWNELGYTNPGPGQAGIPPLGERSAKAIKAGHGAIKDIDWIVRDLHNLRSQLVSELRIDQDMTIARVDAMLGEHASPTPGSGPSQPPHPDTGDSGRCP